MASAKTTAVLTGLTGALGLIMIVAGAALFHLHGSMLRRGAETQALSASGAEAIAAYCRENKDVIEKMPQHPETQQVVDHILDMWRGNAGIDEDQALEAIAKEFKNSPIGLVALRRHLEKGAPGAEAFCDELIEQEPDSRVACMALDHLVESCTGEAAEAFLDSVIAGHPDTRAALFAMVWKGDRARDRGEPDEAAAYWLEAWIAAPERAELFFNKLSLYWIEKGDWYYPLLMPEEFREDRVLTTVKQHALAAARDGEAAAGFGRNITREAGRILQSGNIDSAVAAFARAYESGEFSDKDKALYGIALFLAGAERDYTITLNVAVSLQSRRALSVCRQRGLEWASGAISALPLELRACYALAVARRYLQDGQMRQAVEVLQSTWQDKNLPTSWRERVLERMSSMLIEETRDYAQAARAYGQYADESPQNEGLLRLRAANFFYRERDTKNASVQLDKLAEIPGAEQYLPAALLLRGAIHLENGKTEEAKAVFEQLVFDHPQDKLAAQALSLLGKMAVTKGDADTAFEYFQDVLDRYPGSAAATDARRSLPDLNGK